MLSRILRAWRTLQPERRLAAIASLGLFLTLFLPWYQQTVIVDSSGALHHAGYAVNGFGAFSFVEAAVLLVAAGVITLLFQRAEGRAFHLPGGDGWVISAAGAWTCLLVIWRIFDKNGTHITGPGASTTGVEWGIFVALAVAGVLTYAGSRIRRAHTPEPPLPDEEVDFVLPARGRSGSGGGSGSGAGTGSGRRGPRTGRAAGGSAARGSRASRPSSASGPSSAGEARTAAGASPGAPRRRTDGLALPTPEPLMDPPTLRLSRKRPEPEAEEPPADPQASRPIVRRGNGEDQLTIPFDER